MSWDPGKYAAKATAAATKAARAAAEVTRTTVEKEAESARKQAEKALADAYAEAQSTWEAARDEAMSALGKGGALDDFEERARSIAHEHKDLVGLARRTADQISLSAYENAARSLISAGAITTESQAVDLTQAEGPGAHLTVYFGLEDGEFDGIDVGVEASAGSPVNIYGSVGRTVRLPVLYPTSLYD